MIRNSPISATLSPYRTTKGGETVIEGSRIHMSRSKPTMDTSAPTFSRDMMFVLNDVLGYGDDRIGELLVSGALE